MFDSTNDGPPEGFILAVSISVPLIFIFAMTMMSIVMSRII